MNALVIVAALLCGCSLNVDLAACQSDLTCAPSELCVRGQCAAVCEPNDASGCDGAAACSETDRAKPGGHYWTCREDGGQ